MDAKKPIPDEAFKKVKHGSTTIYLMQGLPLAFFLEANYVVIGVPAIAPPFDDPKAVPPEMKAVGLLKNIIDRKKPATLSTAMAAGLKTTGFSNTVFAVMDINGLEALSGNSTDNIVSIFGGLATFTDIKASAGKVTGLAVKLNEQGGKCKMSTSLICSSPVTAVAFRGIVERTLADIKAKLAQSFKKAENPTKSDVLAFKSFSGHVNTIKVSSAGTVVTTTSEIEPPAFMDTFLGWQGFFMNLAFDRANQKTPPPEKK